MEPIRLIHTYVDEQLGETLVFQQYRGKDQKTGTPQFSWFKLAAFDIYRWMPPQEGQPQSASSPEANNAKEVKPEPTV